MTSRCFFISNPVIKTITNTIPLIGYWQDTNELRGQVYDLDQRMNWESENSSKAERWLSSASRARPT